MAALALAVGSCGGGGFDTCKYVIDDVPDGAACSAIVNKQQCGVNSCTGTFANVADEDTCEGFAAAALCPAFDYDPDTDICQISGCPCARFTAQTTSCFMRGCRLCGPLCAYSLTAVADLQSCQSQARALACVSVVGFDAATQTCNVVGCSVCVDGAVVTGPA